MGTLEMVVSPTALVDGVALYPNGKDPLTGDKMMTVHTQEQLPRSLSVWGLHKCRWKFCAMICVLQGGGFDGQSNGTYAGYAGMSEIEYPTFEPPQTCTCQANSPILFVVVALGCFCCHDVVVFDGVCGLCCCC